MVTAGGAIPGTAGVIWIRGGVVTGRMVGSRFVEPVKCRLTVGCPVIVGLSPKAREVEETKFVDTGDEACDAVEESPALGRAVTGGGTTASVEAPMAETKQEVCVAGLSKKYQVKYQSALVTSFRTRLLLV